jgi:hypothetical protein
MDLFFKSKLPSKIEPRIELLFKILMSFREAASPKKWYQIYKSGSAIASRIRVLLDSLPLCCLARVMGQFFQGKCLQSHDARNIPGKPLPAFIVVDLLISSAEGHQLRYCCPNLDFII